MGSTNWTSVGCQKYKIRRGLCWGVMSELEGKWVILHFTVYMYEVLKNKNYN